VPPRRASANSAKLDEIMGNFSPCKMGFNLLVTMFPQKGFICTG
jgi:hypothetical protein